jgi:peptidoglycan/LPS O-acetylase OafA/YrhL
VPGPGRARVRRGGYCRSGRFAGPPEETEAIAGTDLNLPRSAGFDRRADGRNGAASSTPGAESRPVEPPPARKARFHLTGLDGLRALAVTAVLLYHGGNNWVPGGFLGVDLFFVISGFLITTLILEELRSTGTVDLRNFLARRARRLLPALGLVLGVTLIASALFWRDSLSEVKSGVLASAAYVQNWWLVIHHQDYFASTGRPPPLQHLWSLAIEEQFYLLWPPAVLLIALWLGARYRVGIALIAAFGAVLSALWMTLLAVHGNVPYDHDASRLYFGTDTHASGLLLGCAAAAVVGSRYRERRTAHAPRSRFGDLLGLAALGAFVWVLLGKNEFNPGLYRGGFLAVSALCVVVVVAATRRGSLLGLALDNRPMRWIGRRSYGIYLWHWPVFVVTRPVLDIALGAGALLVPRLAITVGIAALSYRFLEQPIRREGFRPWVRRVTRTHDRASAMRRPALVLAATGLVVAVAFAFARAPVEGSAARSPSFETAQHPRTVVHHTAAIDPATKPPRPVAHAQKPLTRLHVTAIGDSVLESADTAMRQVFPFLTVDADVGRQANQVFDEIKWLQLGGHLGQIVVIAAGSNGIVSGDELDRLLTQLSNRRRVVLVSVNAPRVWQDLNNSTFVSVAERHHNTVIADWHSAASEHPEWLYPDGTHVRPEWAYEYAQIVKTAAYGPLDGKS